MKLTEQEKAILADIRLLESKRVKDDLEFQIGLMRRTQEFLKADYRRLLGLEPPSLDGLATTGPLYADRRPVPMGAAELALEAANG